MSAIRSQQRSLNLVSSWVLGGVLSLAPSAASAGDSLAAGASGNGADASPDLHDAHVGPTPFEVTGAAAFLVQLPKGGGSESLFGGGISASYAFVPHTWAVEIVAHALTGHDVLSFPIDLVLKRDFPIGRVFTPFVTLGPTFIPEVVAHSKTTMLFGVSSSLGTDVWVSDHMGVVLEGTMNLIAHHGPQWEFGGLLGPVVRF